MNFFGHATVAAWAPDATPAFVLGAMLPDFAIMSGVRSLRAASPGAVRGVALHHATDGVFHAAAEFVELTTLVRERLDAAGVPHGAAWAASHVGVELLIDGTLLADRRTCELYAQALGDTGSHATCPRDTDGPRLVRFFDRMRGSGVPYGYADPRFVAARVERALAARPRLAVPASHFTALETVLTEVAEEIRERAATLIDTVRRSLPPETLQP